VRAQGVHATPRATNPWASVSPLTTPRGDSRRPGDQLGRRISPVAAGPIRAVLASHRPNLLRTRGVIAGVSVQASCAPLPGLGRHVAPDCAVIVRWERLASAEPANLPGQRTPALRFKPRRSPVQRELSAIRLRSSTRPASTARSSWRRSVSDYFRSRLTARGSSWKTGRFSSAAWVDG
jgi:hypothetical protein